MKTHKFLFLLFLTSLLFSCTEEVTPQKPTLDRDELLAYVAEMPEFQDYSQEIKAEVMDIIEKKREISKKQFDQVRIIHQKFPSFESFKASADDELFTRYKTLTGIDLIEGNLGSQTKFDIFLDKLNAEVNYESGDLLNALFILESYSLEETEKTQTGCSDHCFISASQQQATIMNTCIQSQVDQLELLGSCRKEARFDFEYTLRGCLSSCDQDE